MPTQLDSAAKGRLAIVVQDRGARYPLTIDPLVQQAYLKASNTGAGDQFGVSVAIAGDTVVVGAIGEASNVNGNQSDNSASLSGAAFVFLIKHAQTITFDPLANKTSARPILRSAPRPVPACHSASAPAATVLTAARMARRFT